MTASDRAEVTNEERQTRHPARGAPPIRVTLFPLGLILSGILYIVAPKSAPEALFPLSGVSTLSSSVTILSLLQIAFFTVMVIGSIFTMRWWLKIVVTQRNHSTR
ncbi:hypothetical protein [Halococcus thailandensis]|uniref:hypothetical protein n=1 Tax=Halococcus thailandensis TaxID=335952 RepID=UPI001268F3BE|nr:hypothetical protein [Halococcus thailandensis]